MRNCMTSIRCAAQRLIITSVHVRAVTEEAVQIVHIALQTCHPQRLIVTNVHICAVLDEEPHNVRMAMICGIA